VKTSKATLYFRRCRSRCYLFFLLLYLTTGVYKANSTAQPLFNLLAKVARPMPTSLDHCNRVWVLPLQVILRLFRLLLCCSKDVIQQSKEQAVRMNMKVISLFDGIGVGRLALEQCRIKVDSYIAYEIHSPSISVAKNNFPDIHHKGDVLGFDYDDAKDVDLLLFGAPCQAFSIAGGQLGFNDERGKLFLKALEIYHKVKPRFVLAENVVMRRESQDYISEQMGVEPIKINSLDYVAQSRPRLYWTNIPYAYTGRPLHSLGFNEITGGYPVAYRGYKLDNKWVPHLDPSRGDYCGTLTLAGMTAMVSRQKLQKRSLAKNNLWRKLTGLESELLQGLPVGYTNSISSNNERRKVCANSWTLPVINDILRNLP